jgi:hypothetical protein
MPAPLGTQDPAIRTDPTVAEGGVLVVTAAAATRSVSFLVPGQRRVTLPVVNGRVEFRVPPQVRGGTRILVSDMNLPKPCELSVEVVGGQGS